jgi:serine/threonine-protein kinase RsbW
MAHFAARLDQLSEVLGFVERCSEDLGASHHAALRAALIVEELFVNSVRHGQAPATSLVRIDLVCADGEVELSFEDQGLPFDPFSHLAEARHRLPADQRPIGGLGVVLIDGFALRHEYARVGPCNRVRIWLAAQDR